MRSYLQLIVLALVLLQSCRPVTDESAATASQEPIGSMDSTSTLTQTTDTTNTGGDSIANRAPMRGDVGSSGDFMVASAEASITAVKLSELAMERSTSKKIRDFAQVVAKDHNASNVELAKLASATDVELPSVLCMECKAKYDALAKTEQAVFDSTYMTLMIKDHKAELERFVFQSTSGSHDEVKKWASQKVPVLQRNLNTAENWQKSGSGTAPGV